MIIKVIHFPYQIQLKDLTYINELLKDLPNAEKFSSMAKTFYEESVERGHGDFLISELIDKEKY